jgi:MoaA/NifB/PqqE/SkfB family radical SAM enzyme
MRIFREAAELGALTIRVTGGEPLLREDFAELYLYARRLGLKVLLFTNARRITPELADLLARVPPLERIEVTVYGMHEETYEAVTRVPGSYAGFRRGVALLLERKVPFVVKGAILPPNRGELDEFESWAATLPWMERSPPCSMFFDRRARRDSEEKNRRIGALRLSPEEGVAFLARKPESYRREMARFCARFTGPPGDRLFACGAGRGGCVDAYGVFQPCMLVRHPGVAYDLKGGSLREALGEVFPLLRERRSVNPEYLARCARCFLKGLCEQCPGKSWAEHGTLDTPVEISLPGGPCPGPLSRVAGGRGTGVGSGKRSGTDRENPRGGRVVMTQIRMDAAYTPSEDVVAREIEGELIIVPLAAGIGDLDDELYTLNETGKVLWARLDGKSTLREIARGLAEEYEAPPGEIEEDVRGLVEELLKRRMVIEAPAK